MLNKTEGETCGKMKQNLLFLCALLKLIFKKIKLYFSFKNATDVCEDKTSVCTTLWKLFYSYVK